mmetsp:Transcript_27818/g.85991  ORF Transcript_27818/g.85991 Transcript_27818/m.85991 type:complete len:305 (-) Transcript_27818:101-1015(-)
MEFHAARWPPDGPWTSQFLFRSGGFCQDGMILPRPARAVRAHASASNAVRMGCIKVFVSAAQLPQRSFFAARSCGGTRATREGPDASDAASASSTQGLPGSARAGCRPLPATPPRRSQPVLALRLRQVETPALAACYSRNAHPNGGIQHDPLEASHQPSTVFRPARSLALRTPGGVSGPSFTQTPQSAKPCLGSAKAAQTARPRRRRAAADTRTAPRARWRTRPPPRSVLGRLPKDGPRKARHAHRQQAVPREIRPETAGEAQKEAPRDEVLNRQQGAEAPQPPPAKPQEGTAHGGTLRRDRAR